MCSLDYEGERVWSSSSSLHSALVLALSSVSSPSVTSCLMPAPPSPTRPLSSVPSWLLPSHSMGRRRGRSAGEWWACTYGTPFSKGREDVNLYMILKTEGYVPLNLTPCLTYAIAMKCEYTLSHIPYWGYHLRVYAYDKIHMRKYRDEIHIWMLRSLTQIICMNYVHAHKNLMFYGKWHQVGDTHTHTHACTHTHLTPATSTCCYSKQPFLGCLWLHWQFDKQSSRHHQCMFPSALHVETCFCCSGFLVCDIVTWTSPGMLPLCWSSMTTAFASILQWIDLENGRELGQLCTLKDKVMMSIKNCSNIFCWLYRTTRPSLWSRISQMCH